MQQGSLKIENDCDFNHPEKTSWMETTVMNKQMIKTGKLASSFKTVQTALEQIFVMAVLRIMLHKG